LSWVQKFVMSNEQWRVTDGQLKTKKRRHQFVIKVVPSCSMFHDEWCWLLHVAWSCAFFNNMKHQRHTRVSNLPSPLRIVRPQVIMGWEISELGFKQKWTSPINHHQRTSNNAQ
jgi:hypothetical protein